MQKRSQRDQNALLPLVISPVSTTSDPFVRDHVLAAEQQLLLLLLVERGCGEPHPKRIDDNEGRGTCRL